MSDTTNSIDDTEISETTTKIIVAKNIQIIVYSVLNELILTYHVASYSYNVFIHNIYNFISRIHNRRLWTLVYIQLHFAGF